MLAAIVRSEPDAPAAEPWWSRMHLRWLVPLTAAAAATVLWMVVPGCAPGRAGRRAGDDAGTRRAERAPPVRPSRRRSRSARGSRARHARDGFAVRRAGQPGTARRRPATRRARRRRPPTNGRGPQRRTRRAPVRQRSRAREEAAGERQALAKQQRRGHLARIERARARGAEGDAARITGARRQPRRLRPPGRCHHRRRQPRAAAGAVAGFADSSADDDSIARRRRALAAAGPGPDDAARDVARQRHGRAQRRWRRHLAAREHGIHAGSPRGLRHRRRSAGWSGLAARWPSRPTRARGGSSRLPRRMPT